MWSNVCGIMYLPISCTYLPYSKTLVLHAHIEIVVVFCRQLSCLFGHNTAQPSRISIKLAISDLKSIPKKSKAKSIPKKSKAKSMPKKSKAKTKKRKKDDSFSLWEF